MANHELLGIAAALATAHRQVWDELLPGESIRGRDTYGFWHEGFMDALCAVAMASGVPASEWPPALVEKVVLQSPELHVTNRDEAVSPPVVHSDTWAEIGAQSHISPLTDQLTEYRGGIVSKERITTLVDALMKVPPRDE